MPCHSIPCHVMNVSACSPEYDESSAKHCKIDLFKKELVENHGCIRERFCRKCFISNSPWHWTSITAQVKIEKAFLFWNQSRFSSFRNVRRKAVHEIGSKAAYRHSQGTWAKMPVPVPHQKRWMLGVPYFHTNPYDENVQNWMGSVKIPANIWSWFSCSKLDVTHMMVERGRIWEPIPS